MHIKFICTSVLTPCLLGSLRKILLKKKNQQMQQELATDMNVHTS